MAKKNKDDPQPRVRTIEEVAHRPFPGPGDVRAPLRVHFSRRAYADLTAHAKESLEAEVCGVLVGEICEDDAGRFVDVHAVVRGNAAREARAQVTFTHETWNRIHAVIDKDYAQYRIVGWYHTHPGFGVEFSAMDCFIQQNFFPASTQIGFLTDPLGGDVSVCFNGNAGIEYMTRFWVDGREHHAKAPETADCAPAGVAVPGSAPDLRRELERLEERISQLILSNDEQRLNFHRMLTTAVVVVCGAVLLFLGYQIYLSKTDRVEPPRSTANYVTVPVKIGDQTAMIGLEVVEWELPPSLNAMMDKYARAQIELAAAERKAFQETKAGQPHARPWYIRLLEAVKLRKPPPSTPPKEPDK
jgi:proteasome lid subunit RPN8/RPN11